MARSPIALGASTTLNGRVAQTLLAPPVFDDFDRFFDHTIPFGAEAPAVQIEEIVQAMQILAHGQPIGRQIKGGPREPVTGNGGLGPVVFLKV